MKPTIEISRRRLPLAALAAGLFASSLAAAADSPEVSSLEAIHVAEIHTGKPAHRVELASQENRRVYVVHTGESSDPYRARVDARHGRLLSLDRKDGSNWVSVYTWPGIRVVAHRGGAFLGPPENTLPAIRKAIEVGANLIEIDIRQTSDGHLILMHDETVDRTTNGSGRVDQLTLEQIQRLEIKTADGQTVRVPTLDEALQAMRGQIDPDLDFKAGNVEKLLESVRRARLVERATLCGAWELCEKVAELEPRIRIRPTAEYPLQVPELIRRLRPAIVNFDWHAVTEESIRLAHVGGCQAFVNCLGSADTDFYVRLAAERGADYIQSDRPDRVVEILQELGLNFVPSKEIRPAETPLRSRRLQYPLR